MESAQNSKSAASAKLNEALTIESMIKVVSKKSGKSTDVRALLGINPEQIKD